MQARKKLAELEAAASEAASQYVRTDAECKRLVEADRINPVKASDPAQLAAILPAPSHCTEEQKAVWQNVVAEGLAKAMAELRTMLDTQFPGVPEQHPMECDQDGAKRGLDTSGSNGEPVVQKPRTSVDCNAAPPAAAINGVAAPAGPDIQTDAQGSQGVEDASLTAAEIASRTQKVLNDAIAAAEEAAAEEEL